VADYLVLLHTREGCVISAFYILLFLDTMVIDLDVSTSIRNSNGFSLWNEIFSRGFEFFHLRIEILRFNKFH